jgi:MarC family integral membrane protein
VAACARLRPDLEQLADLVQATKAALRVVAVRILALEQEIKVADQRLGELVPKAAPRTLGLLAIGIEHAGQLLTTAGDNPSGSAVRPPSPTCCGAAPIPASSGPTRRHRLHRGGDRDANCALHLAVRRGPGQHRLRAARYAAARGAGRDRGDHGVHARGEHDVRAGGVALGLAGVLVVLWLTLRFAGVVKRVLGQPGIELVTRISGLLLTAIAVQLVADAIREFIREGV